MANKRSGARHKWLPVAVLIAASGWWCWRGAYAQYYTVVHYAVLLASALIIAAWFARFGGGSRRLRGTIVWVFLVALTAFFIIFRPVYNGDMGVYRWRLRFAAAGDMSLKQLGSEVQASDWKTTPRDYPRFLGNGFWAEVVGVDLETDWTVHPPQEVWRHEIGAGWSAFAMAGDYAVTQEQRGDNELVTCYRLKTGEPVWSHADKARFDPADAIGGLGDIGPRATPTIAGDRIVTQGGTGIVNCLDARTGHKIWSHDTAEEFGATVTVWGKSGSPLIVDDMAVISVGSPSGGWEQPSPASSSKSDESEYGSSLVAFDLKTGEVRWKAGSRQASYASPVLATLAGERQIIVVNQGSVTAHRPSDGKVFWEIPWPRENDSDASCSQPMPLGGDRLFLSKGYGVGCSLFSISRQRDGQFRAVPEWNPPIKNVMRTKFGNVVIRNGFVYGLDDVLLECIELETGKLQWKKRRRPEFGHGQMMLVGNAILVLSEMGELALVEANPHEFRELAHVQVLNDANVTWNNPAFSPPYLLVRNSREAACYRLATRQQ